MIEGTFNGLIVIDDLVHVDQGTSAPLAHDEGSGKERTRYT